MEDPESGEQHLLHRACFDATYVVLAEDGAQADLPDHRQTA